MAQLFRMPRRLPTQEEIEAIGAEAIRDYKRHERKRLLLLFSGMVALFAAGMVTQYFLSHP